MYKVVVLADSLAPNGRRLFTAEVTAPRFIQAQIKTHRSLSGNAASSRAIPTARLLERVQVAPVEPIHWGENQKGMVAEAEMEQVARARARGAWLSARDAALMYAQILTEAGAHKQIANRILEPWMWMTNILSGTEWANFFALRCHEDAQPEFQETARRLAYAYTYHEPTPVAYGEWHLPLVRRHEREEFDTWEQLRKLSVGRCARVSYLTHNGQRDPEADFAMHDRLAASGHWSPFEHVATPFFEVNTRSGNFTGWRQYRQDLPTSVHARFEKPPEEDWKQWRQPLAPGEKPFEVWEE